MCWHLPYTPPRSKPADESLPLRQAGRRLEIGEVHLDDPSSAAHNWATPVVDDGPKALAARSGIGRLYLVSTPFFWTSTRRLPDGRDRPVSRVSARLKGRLLWAVRRILRRRRSRSSLGLCPPHAATNTAVALSSTSSLESASRTLRRVSADTSIDSDTWLT